MGCRTVFALVFLFTMALGFPAGTDQWDSATDNDNGPASDNEITHGLSQVHDLGAQPGPVPDQDWYRLVQESYSSYEILCDGHTGDISDGLANTLELVDPVGAVLQSSVSYGSFIGFARSLRIVNDTALPPANQYVRVGNATCGTACNTQDQYRIRAWETTVAVPRYNNFGGQVTVLIIQNAGVLPVSGNAYLWTVAAGAPVTTVPFSLAGRQASVINLATVNGGVANGTSGTMTITNNGRYGQLAVKAVALEPATGFSFDSPGLYKPVS